MTLEIRNATERDLQSMLDIYAPYVIDTSISFEYEPPSLDEFKRRYLETSKTHPWLVAKDGGEVIGYAYASGLRTRRAYQWSCEVSIYLLRQRRRAGFGKQLYLELLARLSKAGFHQAFAGVTSPNNQSEGFHASLGFHKIGTYKKVGYKFGQWHDVTWYQLELQAAN